MHTIRVDDENFVTYPDIRSFRYVIAFSCMFRNISNVCALVPLKHSNQDASRASMQIIFYGNGR